MFLIFIPYSKAQKTPLGEFPNWGDSIEQVIKERNIKYPITENSMSLILGIPVQTMLAKDVFDEGIHIDLYSFFYNKLIEFSISIEPNNFEKTYYEIKNNIDILIKEESDTIVITTNKEFLGTIGKTNINTIINTEKSNIIYMKNHVVIKKIKDEKSGIRYIVLYATLDNSYKLYIRIPVSAIEESVKISNELLVLIGGIVILISGILASVISRKFTKPILELNNIANKMAKLDFSQKYRIKDTEDEINELGKSINSMSDKLERTINQLRGTNVELEKDIEEKSKIDEMRKQFISDVSHELKTPITSIMGYADTLLEGGYDEETQNKFLNVIASESRRMARLVTDLLTLSRYDSNKKKTQKESFDLGELVKRCQEKLAIEIKKKGHTVNAFVTADVPPVYADKDDIERVVLNILTNSIKYTPDNGEIKIYVGFVYNDAYIKVFDLSLIHI